MPLPTPETDEILPLWHLAVAGDRLAFGQLAEKLYPSLFHYGTRFTTDRGLIEDTLQDLLLHLWEKRAALGGVVSPKSYLFTALRHNLVRSLRQNLVWRELPAEDRVGAGEEAEDPEWLAATLGESLAMLPSRQREALYLRYYENLSYEEIAAIMGLQRQAVANYLHNGLSRLRRHWQKIMLLLLVWTIS